MSLGLGGSGFRLCLQGRQGSHLIGKNSLNSDISVEYNNTEGVFCLQIKLVYCSPKHSLTDFILQRSTIFDMRTGIYKPDNKLRA